MFFLSIGMSLVTFVLIKIKNKKKIGAGANFGEGGPEKQLFLTMALWSAHKNLVHNTPL